MTIESTARRVDVHRRLDTDKWLTTIYQGEGDIALSSLGVAVSMDALYRNVDFAPEADAEDDARDSDTASETAPA